MPKLGLPRTRGLFVLVSVCWLNNGITEVLPANVEQALRQTQSDISRLRVPQPLPVLKNNELVLPFTKKSEKSIDSQEAVVDVAKVRVVGSSFLTEDQIKAQFAPLQGKKLRLDELRRVAEQLEALYWKAGYFLTRVFVPLQQEQQDVVQIQVVEGYVSAVVVEGATESIRLQVQELLQKNVLGKKWLSLADLDKAKLLVNELPGFVATVKLRSTKSIGASELVVILTALPAGKVAFSSDDNKLPALGGSAPAPLSKLAKPDVPDVVQIAESEISRLRVPQPLPEPKNYDIFIQQTEKTPVAKAVDELQFDLTAVRVDGSSYYTPEQVNAMFAHLVGKKVTISDLRTVAEQLETQYRDAGFFLTRVYLPPQQVKNGVFEVKVIEGYISAGFAEGGNDISRARMEGLLRKSLVDKKPLNLAELERTLLVANDFPGYAASSMLRQGNDLGTSELVATMVDVPGSQNISVNNQSSNVTGPWSFAYSGVFNNTFDRGEQISVSVNVGNDFDVLKSASLKYAEPMGSSGLVGSVGVLMSEAHPAGSVSSLKIASVGSSVTPRLRYPLLRGRDHSVYVETGLTMNKTETTLDGALLTLDQFTVLDANATWLYKTQNLGAGNARLGVSHGVPYFGAMGSDASKPSVVGFESRFVKWTYGVQHTLPISTQWSLQFSLNGQATSPTTKLISGEQVSFGGAALGRGYDGGAISGDTGVGGLIELRYDWAYRSSVLLAPIQLYVFVDAADATANANLVNGTELSYKAIASHGLGGRFVFAKNVTLDVQYANAVHYYAGADTRPNPRLTMSSSISF